VSHNPKPITLPSPQDSAVQPSSRPCSRRSPHEARFVRRGQRPKWAPSGHTIESHELLGRCAVTQWTPEPKSGRVSTGVLHSGRRGPSTLGPGSINCHHSVSAPPSSVPPPGGAVSRQGARHRVGSGCLGCRRVFLPRCVFGRTEAQFMCWIRRPGQWIHGGGATVGIRDM